MLFGKRTLILIFYTINKALLISKHVHIVDPKKFVIAILDISSKTFIIYIAIQEQKKVSMYLEKQIQIKV